MTTKHIEREIESHYQAIADLQKLLRRKPARKGLTS